MGIQGLLPLLSSIQKYAHLRDFAGQKLGIDAYGWLHRGTFTCAVELAQGKPCRAYVDFALSRVRMLQFFGVTPYLVFDGGRLPSKAHTEKDRSERRKEGRRLGLEHLKNGKTNFAYQELQKSIDVTSQMARNLIEELKAAGVEYVVAPYEADSQLVYLEQRGVISGILSEDSDLLVFGANVLITKLDQHGDCVVYRRADLTKCRDISLVNWSDGDFRMMAILSGCDYLPGIPGIGLKSAYRLVRQHKTIEKIVRSLQFDGKKKVPADYLQSFYNADRTFLHQWVYCPEARQLVNLSSLPAGLTTADMPYIGDAMDSTLAIGVAMGDLDPSTKEPLKSTLISKGGKKTQSVQQTPDLKVGKPISEFFKPVRTPLAELDPNSFTPSPTQQRLLNSQRHRSWSARSTPSNQIGDESSVRLAMQRSASGEARSTVLTSLSKSFKQPSEKKRLCTSSNGAAKDATVASPYFSNGSTTKSKAKKSSEAFELYSDDSICEVLHSTAQAAEEEYISSQKKTHLDRSPRKRKRFEVLQDDSEKQRSLGGSIHTDSSTSTLSASFSSTLRSQSSILTTASVDTSATSLDGVDVADTSSNHTVHCPASQQLSKPRLDDLKVPVKTSSFSKPLVSNSIFAEFKMLDTSKSNRHYRADSQKRFPAPVVDKQSHEDVPCSSPCQALESTCRVVADTDDEGSEQNITSPSGTERLLGSEDLLVPQSSPDDDDEVGHMRPKLNLEHFIFAR